MEASAFITALLLVPLRTLINNKCELRVEGRSKRDVDQLLPYIKGRGLFIKDVPMEFFVGVVPALCKAAMGRNVVSFGAKTPLKGMCGNWDDGGRLGIRFLQRLPSLQHCSSLLKL